MDFSLPGYQPEQYDDAERYPLIYWLNSTKLDGVIAAWHTASLSDAPAGWEQVERFSNEETAFETRSLTFVPLRQRMQWYMSLGDGSEKGIVKAIPHYMDETASKTFLAKHGVTARYVGVRSTTQCLAMVQGIEEPVIVQCKGMVAMNLFKRPTKRAPGGIVYQYVNAALALANQTKKGADQIPHFAFWVTLQTPLTPKGKPVTTEVGGGAVVVHPQLASDPAKLVRDDLVKSFIGRDLLQLAHAMYLDGEAWANEPARDDFEGGDAVTMVEPRPAVNAPQPIGEEDSPF